MSIIQGKVASITILATLMPEAITDEPTILWDKITQRNCVVLDCFSSHMFEETTYWQLQQGASLPSFWRRDDQVEEACLFHGYDGGELCWLYNHQFGKSYKGSAVSIKEIYDALILQKADVSHSRTPDSGREIIGDLSDMIVRAMNWRDEGGLGYE